MEADSPSSWNCWRREADAYESGFLHDLPGRLRAPRCFASHEFEPGLVGLWLEDVDDVQAEWSMAHFTAAASNLGELGGAFLADRPVPDLPWLSRGWLRGYVGYNAPMIELLQRSADDPWIRRLFPPEDLRATVEVWDEREWCFEVLARLPQTLCHMDAFSRNLFRCSEPDGEHGTVAIDWAFVGSGAVDEQRHAWMEQLLEMPMGDICERLLTHRRATLRPLLGGARELERDLGLLELCSPGRSRPGRAFETAVDR